jgi:AcrR family transcriptional regulator
MDVNKRKRRTPEEAKALILKVAAERLATLGLDGLNISGVAKAAGISHATVIHHFGSTGAMREALLQQMTDTLLADVMNALDEALPPDEVLTRLFTMLSRDGHGRLLAWLALDRQMLPVDATASHTAMLFRHIIDVLAKDKRSRMDARFQVLLVATAALGLSICGDPLATMIGLEDNDRIEFPRWLARLLQPDP